MNTIPVPGDAEAFAELARHSSVIPERTSSPDAARELVAEFGAAILTGVHPLDDNHARDAAVAVVGETLVVAPDVYTVIVHDGDARMQISEHLPDRLLALDMHSDGYSYGDSLPDWLFLGCESQAAYGGGSILIDSYAVIACLRDAGGIWAEMVEMLETVPIDQIPAFQPRGLSPCIQRTPQGRLFVRRNVFQRVADDAPPGPVTDRHNVLIEHWHALWSLLSRSAIPFRLQPGELLCIDNYRLGHGRLPFVGTPRTFQRVWAWTSDALEIPAGMPPVADWQTVPTL